MNGLELHDGLVVCQCDYVHYLGRKRSTETIYFPKIDLKLGKSLKINGLASYICLNVLINE